MGRFLSSAAKIRLFNFQNICNEMYGKGYHIMRSSIFDLWEDLDASIWRGEVEGDLFVNLPCIDLD